MDDPTRDEFLNHVHQELAHPDIEPEKGSPTKSTQRYRWRELLPWDVEAEARAYWEAVSEDDKTAILPVAGYWGIAQLQLDSFSQQLTSEPGLRVPFRMLSKHPITLPFMALMTFTRKCGLKGLSRTHSRSPMRTL